MDKYFVIYQNDDYIENGVEMGEFPDDYPQVDAFLTELLNSKRYNDKEAPGILWIFKGKKLDWEKYQVETKARIKQE